MFSKTNGHAQGPIVKVETPVKSVPSIISADLSVEGNLSSNGEIQIDGAVVGDISCKALIVGTKGSVTGEVTAQTVRMHGTIKGQVRAKSVFLASSAHMSGDIEHESLAIEPGAFMEGHCKRIAAEAPAEKPVQRPEPVAVKTSVSAGARDKDLAPAQAAAS